MLWLLFLVAPVVIFLLAVYFAERWFGAWGVCAVALTAFFFNNFSMLLFGVSALTLLLYPTLYAIFRAPTGMGIAAAGLALLVAVGLAGGRLWHDWAMFERLAEKYPMQSLEPRLAYESRSQAESHPAALDSTLDHRLRIREDENGGRPARIYMLEVLHSETRNDFIVAQGFGVGRMLRVSEDRVVIPDATPLPLPSATDDSASPEPGPLAEAQTRGGRVATDRLHQLHVEGEYDFLSRERMGFVRSRTEVAGFVPHRFDKMPREETIEDWQITRLELVSLLRHATPVAYVSDHLPDMSQLGTFRTRPLDEFEQAALARLRDDQDLVIDREPQQIRMVGSLRAGKDCTACHSVERGALLGAFSYVLQRKATPPAKAQPARNPSARLQPGPGVRTVVGS